jgi:hypothetical protein
MGLSGKLLQIIALPGMIIIIFAIVAAAAATTATIPKPGCPSHCGDVEIPFPFGLKEGCFLDEGFSITCHNSTTPMRGNIPVRNISTDTHEMHLMTSVSRDCYQYNNSTYEYSSAYTNSHSNWLKFFRRTISNRKNKFTVMGCDTIAYLSGYQNGELYKIGCSSECPSLNNVVSGSCSGVGCCEIGFPDGLKNITVNVQSYYNHSKVWKFNPCGYAFVVEKGKFNFSASYLKNYTIERLPMVVDWSVGNLRCEEARNEPNFACKENSECTDPQTSQAGYLCKCKKGYKGNPYLQDKEGCQGNLCYFFPEFNITYDICFSLRF